MVSLAKVGDFDAIADLNVEAYREFAVRMSPDGWRDMEASLRAIDRKKSGQATFLKVFWAAFVFGAWTRGQA